MVNNRKPELTVSRLDDTESQAFKNKCWVDSDNAILLNETLSIFNDMQVSSNLLFFFKKLYNPFPSNTSIKRRQKVNLHGETLTSVEFLKKFAKHI